MTRMVNDFYETPLHYIKSLKKYIGDPDIIIEPCVGDGAISQQFKKAFTNDIDKNKTADLHLDAREIYFWDKVSSGFIITNPPYNGAFEILQCAFNSTQNPIALCLRLSFLEPVKARREFLLKNPPNGIIVLPRYSFRLNDKGKRQTDSVTCAWMLWRTDFNGIVVEY